MADFIKKGNKRTRDSDEPKTPTTSTTTITTRSKDQNIFEHDIDSYKCASVLLTKIESFDSFKLKLDETISFWKKNGVRGVWFKLTKDLLVGSEQILPYLLKNNFAIHHADGDHIVLTTWLVSGPNTLPQHATHVLGVAGFVYDEQTKEVLVVQERSGPLAKADIWKLPGGRVDPHEELAQAAVREVLEETGIKTKVHSLLAFREMTNSYNFGLTDMFFVVRLTPISREITIQESEIAKATWMKLDDYVNLPYYKSKPGTLPTHVYGRLVALQNFSANEKYNGFEHFSLIAPSMDRNKKTTNAVYHSKL